MKTCTKCKEDKPLDAFNRKAASRDGLRPACRSCTNSESSAWNKANPHSTRAAASTYRKSNQGKVNALQAKRRSAKLQQTPSWADYVAIANHYLWASCMKEVMGVDVHVDHEVPLNHPKVSGLHTHDNLQLLSAEANLKKSNQYE